MSKASSLTNTQTLRKRAASISMKVRSPPGTLRTAMSCCGC